MCGGLGFRRVLQCPKFTIKSRDSVYWCLCDFWWGELSVGRGCCSRVANRHAGGKSEKNDAGPSGQPQDS
eukprot:5455873-Pyramimonas_sp.AAC.1